MGLFPPEMHPIRHNSPVLASGYNESMHDIPSRIADILLEVEATLRSNGLWDAREPACGVLNSTQPFCLDTLRFEQWLQWVFLPRMKHTLENTRPLPEKSGIFVYAREYLRKSEPSTRSLLMLMKRFDDLIHIHSTAGRH